MAINCQKIDHTFVEVVRKGWDAKVSKRPETNAEVVGGDGAEAVDDEAVENSVSFFEFSVWFCHKLNLGTFQQKKCKLMKKIIKEHHEI